jgi:hypothetical protein
LEYLLESGRGRSEFEREIILVLVQPERYGNKMKIIRTEINLCIWEYSFTGI